MNTSMSSRYILHITVLDKFIPSYIDLIRNNFGCSLHRFVIWGNFEKYPYKKDRDTLHYNRFRSAIGRIILEANRADRIIIHGLYDWRLAQLLACMPWLHHKCHWVMWGGDLYFHQLNRDTPYFRKAERYRQLLIARMGGLVTYIEGDFRRAVDWYGATGKMFECIMYTSNIFHGEVPKVLRKESKGITLLTGNSADPTNNHRDIFNKIMGSDQLDLVECIYCPLSYGNPDYAIQMKKLGEELFGDKFVPLLDFIPIDKYKKILESVDVAIFAHNRQQAMGNTINLLGMGKKVIMRTDTSSWTMLNQLGIRAYTLDEFDISVIDHEVAIHNYHIVRNYFSEENLVRQLHKLFS